MARFINRRYFVTGSAALAVLTMTGCAPGASLPPLPPSTDQGYYLGAGDRVRVITFGEGNLTGEFRISDSGTIALPLLGTLKASGLTTAALADRIASALQEKKLFATPSVSVEVVAYRPFFVLGEVNKPGQYPYQPGMTVLTAVAVAGGFTYRAIQDYASIVRVTNEKAVEGKVGRATLVEPGDTITVFERLF
jgi:polysaccharide export outer membrane protein